MANSYAANAVAYFTAMKQADPNAKIGSPWAFEPTEASGAGVVNSDEWNNTVETALAANLSFVDAHWYPFSSVSGLTDTQILASITNIPASAQRIRTTLQQNKITGGFIVGESNISNSAQTQDFQPVAALFAAGTALAWLSQGAMSYCYWDMHNFGSPQGGDFGMFTSADPTPSNAPLPAYYGYFLASLLTRFSAPIATFTTGSSTVLGFQTGQAGGSQAVLLLNTSTSQSATVPVTVFPAGSSLRSWTYSAANATATNPVTQGTTTAAQASSGVVLPAESIVVVGTAN
jgi:hypothetical protein